MTTVAAVVAAAVAVVVAVVAVGCFLSMTLTLNTDHSVTYLLARLLGRDSTQLRLRLRLNEAKHTPKLVCIDIINFRLQGLTG